MPPISRIPFIPDPDETTTTTTDDSNNTFKYVLNRSLTKQLITIPNLPPTENIICSQCGNKVTKAIMIIETDSKNAFWGYIQKFYCKECFKKEFVSK